MRNLRSLLLIALGGVVLSACTAIPTSTTPQALPNSHVPFGLENQTIPGTKGAKVQFETKPIYFIDASNRLAPASRIVASPPTLDDVLNQLLIGPSAIEQSAGYVTALPRGILLLSASVKNGVGYISFTDSLTKLPEAERVLAEGEIAMTAVDAGATNGVQISVGSLGEELITPSGKTVNQLSASDFTHLLSN
jgi:hypothetical protein